MTRALLKQNGVVPANSYMLRVAWKPGGLHDVTAMKFKLLHRNQTGNLRQWENISNGVNPQSSTEAKRCEQFYTPYKCWQQNFEGRKG